MKISAAMREAMRVYAGHFGASMKFLTVEGCMTLAAFAPLLFFTNDRMQWLSLLAVPFYLLLMLWARVNAATAMADALGEGSLFSYRLIDPSGYGKKLAYGLKRCVMLLIWSAPLIAFLVIAKISISGETDGLTLLRQIKSFGGGDLTSGLLYLALIFAAAVILLGVGCAFHSGDRHAFARGTPALVRGHHGKIILCWLCSLISLLPIIIAVIAVIIRYLPALQNLNAIMTKTADLPDTKTTLIMLAAGAVLTLPFLPFRALIPAAFVGGLVKEKPAK